MYLTQSPIVLQQSYRLHLPPGAIPPMCLGLFFLLSDMSWSGRGGSFLVLFHSSVAGCLWVCKWAAGGGQVRRHGAQQHGRGGAVPVR